MRKVKKWTLEMCMAVSAGYTNRRDFELNEPTVCCIARRNRWHTEVCKHMPYLKDPNYWTKERLIEFTSQCKTITEFHKQSGARTAAIRYGMYAEVTKHMIRGTKRIHTRESIEKVIQNCKTLKDFYTGYPYQANAARKLGIYEELTKHLKRTRTK